MTDYDVIVVGCGPAGLMACAELAKRNIPVLGIDKKPILYQNFRSASGFCFLDQPFNFENIRMEHKKDSTKLHYTDTGFSIDYSASMEGIYFSHMFSDTGKHWQAQTLKKPFYNLFNPSTWLSDQFKAAKRQGAEFLPSTVALKTKQGKDRVEMLVRTNGQNQTLTCKRLIASDGLSSRIAHSSGKNKERTFYGKGAHIEYEMVDIECPYDRGDMFFFGAKNFGGRAGMLIMVPSPNGNNAFRIEGMCVLPASNANELIDYFITKGPYAKWFKNAKIVEKSGAMVELLTPMVKPYQDNIVFVGDSAAWAECLYQCATMAGYKAAVSCEMELAGEKGFEEYTKWWGEHFEWVKNPKRMADYGKRVFFPRFFTVKELDFLFELSQKNPIVVDEAEATPYDFTAVVFRQFMDMPEVPDYLKVRMQEIIDADQEKIATVIGKIQK